MHALGPALPVTRAPYAVTVVAAPLPRASAPSLSLAATLAAVPGVEVDDRHDHALGDRISIRGFGARSQFGVRGVAVRLDGVPLTLPDGQTTLSLIDPAFLDRVEALRGPASALYGNAAGGVLLLETRPPPSHGTSARGEAVAGSWGVRRIAAEGGAAWGGGGGVRAAVSRVRSGGFRRHAAADVWRGHARARLAMGAEAALDIALDGTTYDAQNPGSLSDSLLAKDPRAAFATNVRDDTGERADAAQLAAHVRVPLGAARLDVTGYGRLRRVDNPIPTRVVAVDRRVGGVEARVASGEGGGGSEGRDEGRRAERGRGEGGPEERGRPIAWIAGVQLGEQSDLRRNFANEAGARGDVVLDQRERVRLGAIFARVYARAAEHVGVLAGLRYDAYRFRAIDHLVSATDPDDSGRRAMAAWSPTLGVDVALAPSLAVYANAGTAFETPTTSELTNRPSGAGGFNAELQPQRTVSVEVGAKGLLRGRVLYELAAYRARVRDELVPFEVEAVPGRQYFRNAGSAVHRGIEVLLRVALSGGLEAHAAYTLTDARFDAYRLDGVDLHGHRVPGVAPQRLDVGAAWRTAGVRAAADARFVGATPVDDAAAARSPGYVVVDLAFDAPPLALGAARATPFLAIDNVLDRAYVGSVTVNAFGGRYYEPAPRRSIYAGLRFGG